MFVKLTVLTAWNIFIGINLVAPRLKSQEHTVLASIDATKKVNTREFSNTQILCFRRRVYERCSKRTLVICPPHGLRYMSRSCFVEFLAPATRTKLSRSRFRAHERCILSRELVSYAAKAALRHMQE